MKKIIYSFSLLVASILMCSATAGAATYTAVASGNWSDAATWGGTAPGSHLTFDNVVIPSGFTVTLDTDLDFDGGLLFSLNVNGELSSDDDSQLKMSSGSLTGNGTIDLSYFEISGLSTVAFTGDIDVARFRNNATISVTIGAHVTLQDSLYLSGGILSLGNGSSWTMNTDAVIKVEGGSIALNGGIMTATNDYHVWYTGNSLTSGIEASWTGLTDVKIDLSDDNKVWTMGNNLIVKGELKQMSGWIKLNGKKLSINGDYNNTSEAGFRGDALAEISINSTANWTSDLMFEDGSEKLDNLHLNMADGMTVNLVSDLNISGDLILDKGDVKIMNGSSLTMEDNSNVKVDGGGITTDNGIFNGVNDYNVWYVGSASETGIEMTGAGLNDVNVDLDDEEGTVKMNNNYTVHGDLILTNGILDMNENDLTLTGGFQAEENGYLMADENSSLTINGNANWTDTLYFADNGNTLDQLTLNVTGGHHIMIGSDLTVNDIQITHGSILIFDNMLTLASGGTITGYDEDNYVMIDGSGQLKIEMSTGGTYTTFPVGTMDGYSPAMLQYNNGATSSFMVGVEEGVWAVGTYGDDLAETESIVDRTWTVNSTAGATSDIDMKLLWSQSMEVNGFSRTNARISGFSGGSWDYSAMGSAVTTSNGMYELSRDGVTNMGPFAITDGNSALEIPQNSALIAGVYPNPADEKLNVSIEGAAQVELIDAYGKIVSSANTKESGIIEMNLTSLPAGMYYVRANANGAFTTQKVVKK